MGDTAVDTDSGARDTQVFCARPVYQFYGRIRYCSWVQFDHGCGENRRQEMILDALSIALMAAGGICFVATIIVYVIGEIRG